MTKGERQELGQLIRKREKVMKTLATERSAALLADYDAQSAKIYHYDDDEVWAGLAKDALSAVARAQAAIAERCTELGIPREFAPGLEVGWYGRGQNAAAQRRAELRRHVNRAASCEYRFAASIPEFTMRRRPALGRAGMGLLDNGCGPDCRWRLGTRWRGR